MDIFEEIVRLRKVNQAFAVATIVESKGSTPRSSAKMLVRSDLSIEGTIGGGPLEMAVIREAGEAIIKGADRLLKYDLNSRVPGALTMLCGGLLSVFIEVQTEKPLMLLVGAGHVGKALARLASRLGYHLVVADDREGFASKETLPEVSEFYINTDIGEAVRKAPITENTYVALFTQDVDDIALKAVLERDAAYVGMIGSSRKSKMIKDQLRALGVSEEKLAKVRCPIGLDLGAETPDEIAVSIIAEIMAFRTGTSAKSLSV
ncbi:hypothetical protein MASR2M78_20920 [Treponema sp.]